MSHATYTKGNRVDFWLLWLLMVRNQIANLIPGPSFGHNLCFRCPNEWCEPILDIYVSITLQWYKELFEPLGFDPWNRSLNIRESTKTLTPKMEAPLRMWGFIPSHFPSVADGNSHKTRNNTLNSKTRTSNTRSEKARRASTTGVDESEGECLEALYSYC